MTSIEWTDETWNPVTGCSHVSDGCRNCYAEDIAKRFSGTGSFPVFKPWTAPNAAHNVVLHPERLGAPLHWRKPRRVFVNSMSDLFHELVPEEFIDRVFAVMALSPQHTYQVLTKRPERMLAYFAWDREAAVSDVLYASKWPMKPEVFIAAGRDRVQGGWPLPNVWLGVSAEDQRTADERIPVLLDTPATIRFVSAEPLLGPIDLERYPSLDWVIAGGESGHGARPCNTAWIQSIIEQCRAAGTAVFVKQLGSAPAYPREANGGRVGHYVGLHDRKGGDPAEWPDDLRVREWPTEGVKA